jgi:hypothetical protein
MNTAMSKAYKYLPVLQLICSVGAAGQAWSQESLTDQTKALTVISDTADRLCGNAIDPAGQKTKTSYNIAASTGLDGVLAKLVGLGVKANADLSKEEYHGVVQEQLASALKDSQDCKRDVFKILVDRILLPREPPRNNAGTVQRIDADVSEICSRLKYWPENTSEISDLKTRIVKLSEQISQQIIDTNIPPYIMAKLNRCIGAVNLISDPGLPGSIRNSLPYFDRSLAFEPDQKLLRKNVEALDEFLKTGSVDGVTLVTTMLQILRGGDDPDIPKLAKQYFEVIKQMKK